MGNNTSKESRSTLPGSDALHSLQPSGSPSATQQAANDRPSGRAGSSRSRHDIPFLILGRDRDQSNVQSERPRETKQEREARRAEREKQARLRDRERSLKEEGVDGGFLVTLGTYTGPEDFSKTTVRQLQIERRLAPFWKGLNDHDESWTEAQLVAAVRGLPIPAADEIPDYLESPTSAANRSGVLDTNGLPAPTIDSLRPESPESADTYLPASQQHSSSLSSSLAGSSALLKGRAKTLASLATGARGQSQDMIPQEIRLPHDPYVNGVPIEAHLYREPIECPICFLYYPPYLNRTRCCDQPICSECFVQIKRPDPHPPEHEQPGQPRPPEEEAELLVSEVAACPFCVTPEFGIVYNAPPFRRGLSYANQSATSSVRQPKSTTSPTSSSTSVNDPSPARRRAVSFSATAPQVITTDKVRPDWAKKLADARANALRRSAAATALHNAAYVLGNQGDAASRGPLAFGRRRRPMFVDSPSGTGSGSGTPRLPEDGSSDLFPGRTSSRRTRVDDLEELMMMEAIRLSLVAEEERKRKEDKETRKEDKKRAKEIKKEAKQAEKFAKRNSTAVALYPSGTNESTSTWTSMTRSSSHLGQSTLSEDALRGKGKGPSSANALHGSSSMPGHDHRNDPLEDASSSHNPTDHPQRHLEESRLLLNPLITGPIPTPGARALHTRQLSNASSVASSYVDSTGTSFRAESSLPSHNASGLDLAGAGQSQGLSSNSGSHPGESMFNFQSLAAMVGEEDKGRADEHLEYAPVSPTKLEDEVKEPSASSSPVVGSIDNIDSH